MSTEKIVIADKITFCAPGEGPEQVYSIQQSGWEWVKLPKPTLRRRLMAWWQGETLPTEELRPRMVIALRGGLIADGTISAEEIKDGL